MELIRVTPENLKFESVLIDSREKAQDAPAAVTNFALFYQGKFLTHEILSVGKFEKLAGALMKTEEV